MALSRLYGQTDTGGSSKANNNYFTYTSPSAPSSTAKKSSVPSSTGKTSSAIAKAATQTAKATVPSTTGSVAGANRTYATYSSPSYSTTSGTAATAAEKPVDNASKNWNAYLKLLNESYTNEAKAINANATNYNNAANQNITNSQNQYNAAYNANKAAIDQLEAQNRLRENATNQAIANYYQNIVDSYNRSMGYIDQGFDEGNSATAMARDEAIELAAQLYAMGEESQNRQTEKDLRGQYASYMKGLKNMNQRLASMGINGGAAETTLLGALNGYEGNRADLEEARQAALGQLRQQQMQSDSEAQQAYLNKLADLISNRTSQQLGVENTRSSNEGNYANMQTSAQNNFQQWASDLVGKRSTNETTYADAVRQLADMANTAAYNTAAMQNDAASSKSANYSSTAYLSAVDAQSQKNAKAAVKKTKAQKEKEKKQKEKEKKKNTKTLKAADETVATKKKK